MENDLTLEAALSQADADAARINRINIDPIDDVLLAAEAEGSD